MPQNLSSQTSFRLEDLKVMAANVAIPSGLCSLKTAYCSEPGQLLNQSALVAFWVAPQVCTANLQLKVEPKRKIWNFKILELTQTFKHCQKHHRVAWFCSERFRSHSVCLAGLSFCTTSLARCLNEAMSQYEKNFSEGAPARLACDILQTASPLRGPVSLPIDDKLIAKAQWVSHFVLLHNMKHYEVHITSNHFHSLNFDKASAFVVSRPEAGQMEAR